MFSQQRDQITITTVYKINFQESTMMLGDNVLNHIVIGHSFMEQTLNLACI